jgi:Ca-activated chloride channel homolog
MKKYIISVILLMMLSVSTFAMSWTDLWFTSDQQGARAFKKNDYLSSLHYFKNPAWRGAAWYRSQDYAKAYSEFSTQKDAVGFYNQGNALAHMGAYAQAIAAYNKALALNPSFTDAKYNKEIIEKIQKDQKKHSINDTESTKENTKPSEHKQKTNDLIDQKKQAENKKMTAPKEPSAQDTSPPSAANPAALKRPALQKAEPSKSLKDTQLDDQLLGAIIDDSGSLLKQKFLRDHGNYRYIE